jgi:hypothetical protein
LENYRVRVFAKFEIPRRVRGPSWKQKKKARRGRGLALSPCLDSSIPRFSNSFGPKLLGAKVSAAREEDRTAGYEQSLCLIPGAPIKLSPVGCQKARAILDLFCFTRLCSTRPRAKFYCKCFFQVCC